MPFSPRMSIARQDGSKAILPRDREGFWLLIEARYARRNRQRWKWLAAFVLREAVGWSLESIALAVDHSAGHVRRKLDQVRDELAENFGPPEPVSDRGYVDGDGI